VLSATTGGGTQYAFWQLGTPVVGVSSIWARCATGTNSITVFDGGGAHTTVLNLTTAWQRFTVTNFNADAFYVGSYQTGIPGGTVYVWGAQSEPGTQPSSTFITGSTITATRSRDQHQINNPLFGLNPANWSFGATLTPLSTWANLNTADQSYGLFLMFGAQTTANSARAFISFASLEFDVWDATVTDLTKYANSSLVGSTPISPSFFDQSGVLTITPPGTPASAGIGTGVITTQPATLTLGYIADPYSFQGWLSNLWINNHAP
jgi:hypothetical protein